MMKKASGLILMMVLIPFGVAGCSFCVGSGCPSSGIDFGTSFKKDSSGDISIQGKKDTFKVGETVAMVAHLSDSAGTKQLTLEVTTNGKAKDLPYPVSATNVNVLAFTFTGSNLAAVGFNVPGKHTVKFLHGSNDLADGSLTIK